MPIKSFRDLRIWQAAHELVLEIYRLSRRFPSTEIYGLTSQIRRSAASVPANIAEGFARRSTKELVQFLYTARGSLAETEYHCILADALGYLPPGSLHDLSDKYARLNSGVNVLINKLKQKIS